MNNARLKSAFLFVGVIGIILMLWFAFELKNPSCVNAGCMNITTFARTGEYTVQRTSPGISDTVMIPFANSTCMLTKMEYQDIDDGGERSGCEALRISISWVLRAEVSNRDADSWCGARCLSYTN